MEPEQKQAELKAPDNQEDLLNKKVGNIEVQKLQPADVVVLDISIQDAKKKDGTVIGKMAHCMCKHPDKEEAIDITKVLFRKDEKESVKESGLWYGTDKEDNIQMGSAMATLMEHYKVLTLKELEGKVLQTDINEAGYLCFKGY